MKTSRETVRHYRNYKFSVEKLSGSACGFYTRTYKTFTRRLRIIRYRNDSLGITFEFKSEFKNRIFKYFHKPRLDMITLTKMPFSTNKITIGKTTRHEIINLYGPLPEDRKDEEYMDYELKGIAFTFSENSILTKIEILTPATIDQINAF